MFSRRYSLSRSARLYTRTAAGLALLLAASGCDWDGHHPDHEPEPTYSVGGAVTGLNGTLTLANNGGDNLTLSQNGSLAFATKLTSGKPYAVTIVTQPVNQQCSLANGNGSVASTNVTTVTVTCVTTAVSATVGAAGGTVDGPDGVQVVIPAGALSANTTIGIRRDTAGAPSLPATFAGNGFAYEFTPHGITFDRPVTVRLPQTAGGTGATVLWAEPDEGWSEIDGVVEQGKVAVARNRFSWGLVRPSCAYSPNDPNLDPSGCILPRGVTLLTASPSVLTQVGVIGLGGGDYWLHYSLDRAATLSFRFLFRLQVDISNLKAKFADEKFDGTNWIMQGAPVDRALGTRQDPNAQPPSLSLSGETIFTRPVTSNDNGKHRYRVTLSWERKGRSHVASELTLVDIDIPPPPASYTIGGTLTGLAGAGLVLQNNSGDDLAINNNGAFSFSVPVGQGTPYGVTVKTQPSSPTQVCTVQDGSGVAQAAVTNVSVNCVTVQVKGWQAPKRIGPNSGGNADSAQVAFDGLGNALVVYAKNDGTAYSIMANRYSAQTGAWSTETLLETSSNDAYQPHVAVDADGNGVAVWRQWDGANYQVFGNTFTPVSGWGTATVISGSAPSTSDAEVAFDSTGHAVIAWVQSTRDVYVNSYQFGTGWGAPALLKGGTYTNAGHLRMDASNGTAVVVWAHGTSLSATQAWAARYTSGGGWGTPQSLQSAGGGETPSVAVDRNGNATATWVRFDPNDSGSGSQLATSRYVGGVWSAEEIISSADMSMYATEASVDVLPTGEAFVLWGQGVNDGAEIMINRRDSSGSWAGPTAIDPAPTSSFHGGEVAFDALGNAIALWTRNEGIVTRRYTVGSGWSAIEVLDASAREYFSPSLAIDANGNAIAVWNQTDGTRNNVWGAIYQ